MSLFKEICDILDMEKNNIFGCTLSESAKSIQEIVKQLIKKAYLPDLIADRFIAFADYEGLLYSTKSYRDHFFHPFHTFLLGFLLLKKLRSLQGIPPPFPLNDVFLKKWLVTSLLHDITYAAEMGPDWLKDFIKEKLEIEIRTSQEWGPVLSNKWNISAVETLSFKFENKNADRSLNFRTWLTKQLENRHEHGVLSAILLLNDTRKNNWKDRDFFEECALAISLHNYHRSLSGDTKLIKKGALTSDKSPAFNIGSLHVTAYPLAYLLAYCDNAQEWGRPDIRHPDVNINYYEIKIIQDKKDKQIQIFLNYVIKGDHVNVVENKESERLKELEDTWIADIWQYCVVQRIFKYEGENERKVKDVFQWVCKL